MARAKKWLSPLLGLVLIAIAVWAIAIGIRWFWGQLVTLDTPVVVGVISAMATVIAATTTVMLGRYYERKREIEAHFRADKIKIYDEFLTEFFKVFHGGEKADSGPTVEFLRAWNQKLILWSGPEVMMAYMRWTHHMKRVRPNIQTVLLMDKFFRALRFDIGQGVRTLPPGALASLNLREGDLFLEQAQKNPLLTLAELADMEKARSSSQRR